MSDNICKYNCALSEDEVVGLEWLDHVLDAILENPTHKSYAKAMGATMALHKMGKHLAELHGVTHAMESRLIQYAHTRMYTMPPDSA